MVNVTRAKRGKLAMLAAGAALALAVTLGGCSGGRGAEKDSSADELAQQKQENKELRKQVEEMEDKQAKEEKEDLQRQIDELEAEKKEAEEQEAAEPASEPEEQAPEQVEAEPAAPSNEDAALADAETYYAAVEAGDYEASWSMLTEADQQSYPLDTWVQTNSTMDSQAATFEIHGIRPADIGEDSYYVDLTVYGPDGSATERTTVFYYQYGEYRHYLTDEEMGMFDQAMAENSSSLEQSSPEPSADTASGSTDMKTVEVRVESSGPADYSAIDDKLRVSDSLEVNGSETFTYDLPQGDGLMVDLMTESGGGSASIEVYEDGELVAQDSDDSLGWAQVSY